MKTLLGNLVRRALRPRTAPQTMETLGLRFLNALAAERTTGVFLEVGPLFGSSTNAINAGRTDPAVPIHTIDTFEAAPWVRKRFGIDLSRARFDRYTKGIANLRVHQGYAPGVVQSNWTERIGFYFDDATHGDPGWTDNYAFFSQSFTDDCLVCGDDFAHRWPDIIRNVHQLAEAKGVQLYIMGIVWAFTQGDPARIERAVHAACPALAGAVITTTHKGTVRSNLAACWSWGLFRAVRMESFGIQAGGGFSGQMTAQAQGKPAQTVTFDGAPLQLEGVTRITYAIDRPLMLNFCIAKTKGRSRKSQWYQSAGGSFDVPEGHSIVAVRLMERDLLRRIAARPLKALHRLRTKTS